MAFMGRHEWAVYAAIGHISIVLDALRIPVDAPAIRHLREAITLLKDTIREEEVTK